ncbi:hypothetical protein [Rhizobium rhizogenes]
MSEPQQPQSPFYDDISDSNERDRYKLHARETYDRIAQLREETFKGHVEYGKWLIASLLAVHGGAVFAISGLKGSVKPEQLPGLIDGAALNLTGIFLTLLAGFFAWLNFQFAQATYTRWQKPEMLYRSDGFPTDLKGAWKVSAAMYVAAVFGIIASLCFVLSSYFVISALKGA